MNAKIIRADGSTYELTTEGWSQFLAAAVAFGWEPAEFAPRLQSASQGDGADRSCSDRKQSAVNLIGALERVMAAVATNPCKRDKQLAAGITTKCFKCREELRQTRLLAIEPFDDDDGGQVLEDLLNTLAGHYEVHVQ